MEIKMDLEKWLMPETIKTIMIITLGSSKITRNMVLENWSGEMAPYIMAVLKIILDVKVEKVNEITKHFITVLN